MDESSIKEITHEPSVKVCSLRLFSLVKTLNPWDLICLIKNFMANNTMQYLYYNHLFETLKAYIRIFPE